ncbi:MAG: DUF4856 domain-containing protein [Crocinitomicaceae bacterium]
MKKSIIILAALIGTTAISCKKEGCTDSTANNYNSKAKKDDGSCTYDANTVVPVAYTTPSTFEFTDANGNSTVSFSGQTNRLDKLSEMVTYMKTGKSTVVDAVQMKDMFGDNVGQYFTDPLLNASTKQLKNKCFPADVATFETFMDELATASIDNAEVAANGQAGTLSSGTSTYLFDANGIEKVQLVEKGLMGAVFLNQALNTYFGADKMDVDNTTAVDSDGGKYYTLMEHHWDEAYGYFTDAIDYPTSGTDRFWGKYCNKQDGNINCNADMMDNLLMGRAALSSDVLTDRDAAIATIRTEWEDISANQAMTYLDESIPYFGSDNAKFLHVLAEAWAFAWNLRYAPVETRRMSVAEHTALMGMFKANFWEMTVADVNAIKAEIDAKY